MNILKLFKKKKKGIWHSWEELPCAYKGRDIVYVCPEVIGFETFHELYIANNKTSFSVMKCLHPFCIWAYRDELADYISKKYWCLLINKKKEG